MSTENPTPDSSGKSQPLRLLLTKGVGVRSFALTVLMLLAVLYSLHIAKPVILPIVLALLLSLLLSPFVRLLQRKLRIPLAIGSGLVLVGLLGILGITGSMLVEPAAGWIQTIPARLPELRDRLTVLKNPLDKFRKATQQVEEITDLNKADNEKTVKIKETTTMSLLMTQTPAFLANLAVMFILLFFMLASGDVFLRKLVRMIPSFEDKRRAVVIARDIEERISRYLRAVTVINLLLGFAVGLAAYFVGLENYVLFGGIAFLLNFIPYLGAIVGILTSLLVCLLSFESTSYALVFPAIYFSLNLLEGSFLTPIVVGRLLTLNTVMVFVFLMFWGWIWGIAGALLAVPILAILKIICDHIEPLAFIGEFIGGEVEET